MEPSAEHIPSVLDESAVRSFVADRNIRTEDLPLIQELAAFDKNLVTLSLHNMFNMYKERSAQELQTSLSSAQNNEEKRLFETALRFLNRYDWAVAWNLVRILEDR